LGFSKPILSGKKLKTVKSEYLSRAFALDLKSLPQIPGSKARGREMRGSETERGQSRHRNGSQRPLPSMPPWQPTPQFEGLLSVIPPLTARGRMEGDYRGGRPYHEAGRIEEGTNEVEDLSMDGQRRGVQGERTQLLKLPSSAALEEVRREIGMYSASGQQVGTPSRRLPSAHRLDTQKSIRTYNSIATGSSSETDTLRRDLLLAPLGAMVPKIFKGGRSFPLGRGGTDHRQMLGIPSTSNNPAVVAAREALRRRFRSTVEAFAFLSSFENAEVPGDVDWVESLSADAISQGFLMLRIRVDVSQLMLQIGDKDLRLSLTSSLYSTMESLSSRCRTGASRARQDGSSVNFSSWNQQMSWHPPLLNPGRSLVEARAGLAEIRATAMRATAAMNTMKASTWRTPVSQKEIEDTLGFVKASRDLFEAFAVPRTKLATGDQESHPPELFLTYRDMEALYRQVHVLPGMLCRSLVISHQRGGATHIVSSNLILSHHSTSSSCRPFSACIYLHLSLHSSILGLMCALNSSIQGGSPSRGSRSSFSRLQYKTIPSSKRLGECTW